MVCVWRVHGVYVMCAWYDGDCNGCIVATDVSFTAARLLSYYRLDAEMSNILFKDTNRSGIPPWILPHLVPPFALIAKLQLPAAALGVGVLVCAARCFLTWRRGRNSDRVYNAAVSQPPIGSQGKVRRAL